MTVLELRTECRNRGLRGYSKLRKADLVALLAGDVVVGDGVSPPTPTVVELRAEAKLRGLRGYSRLRKGELLQLLGVRSKSDDDELVAAIAAMPPSLVETIAVAKYLIRETSPDVEAIMKDRERRGILAVRNGQPTVEGWKKWNERYAAACGVVGAVAAAN